MAKKKGETDYARRSRMARAVGFKNYGHYRRETSKRKIQAALKATGVRSGWHRYELAALLADVARLPYATGGDWKWGEDTPPPDPDRTRKAGILSDAIRRAEKSPARFWKTLGSPKKPPHKVLSVVR